MLDSLIFVMILIMVFPHLTKVVPTSAIALMLMSGLFSAASLANMSVWLSFLILLVFVGGIFITFLFMAMFSEPSTPPSSMPMFSLVLGVASGLALVMGEQVKKEPSWVQAENVEEWAILYSLAILTLMAALVWAVKISTHSHHSLECL